MPKKNTIIDIQACRSHHEMIRHMMGSFSNMDMFDEKKMRSLLEIFDFTLRAHLHLEDNVLYPRLLASADKELADKAERFVQQRGGLQQQFDNLKDKWNKKGKITADPVEFNSEFAQFLYNLSVRMDLEDKDLYVDAEQSIQKDLQ